MKKKYIDIIIFSLLIGLLCQGSMSRDVLAKKKETTVKEFTLSAAGDCTFARDSKQPSGVNFPTMYKKKGAAYFLKKVKPVFAKDDLTLVNFEGTLII